MNVCIMHITRLHVLYLFMLINVYIMHMARVQLWLFMLMFVL